MSFKLKDPNGQIVYIGRVFGCKKYHVTYDEDKGVTEIKCVASTVKRKCKNCSLVNTVRPQYLKLKTGDRVAVPKPKMNRTKRYDRKTGIENTRTQLCCVDTRERSCK